MWQVLIHDHFYPDEVISAGSFETLVDAFDFVNAISSVMVACAVSIQKGEEKE